MTPEGRGTSGVMLMGEALGEAESRDELPFRPYAEAGSVLERALYRAGIPRDSLTITNLVWYQPPRNWLDGAPWERDAIRACKPFNAELVERVRPRVIVALGGMAFRELTGLSGEKCGIGMTRGFIVPGVEYSRIPVIGTFHPSFLRRGSKERQDSGPRGKVDAAGGGTQGMSLLGVLIRDLQLAAEVAQNHVPKFAYHDYRLGAGLGEWRRALEILRADSSLAISYDFETVDSLVAADESEMEITRRDVTQVQMSWSPGQAIVSPWIPEILPVLREILELPNPKIDWNGRKFDRPILREMGIRTDLGEWHDGMDYWHHAQPDLARGLQFATSFFVPEVGPWKHLNASDPLWYGALDVDMPQKIFAGLGRTLNATRHPISGISLGEGYRDQVLRLAPVLDRMTARGIPVDDERRRGLDVEFTAKLQEIAGKAQGMFPEALRTCVPRGGFVRTPDELLRTCPGCDGKKKLKLDGMTRKEACTECSGRGKVQVVEVPAGFTTREFVVEVKCGCGWAGVGEVAELPEPCALCNNSGRVAHRVSRWVRLEEFKPGSWQQVLRYIEWRRDRDIEARAKKYLDKHPGEFEAAARDAENRTEWLVPMDHKTGKPTTGEAELRRLAKKTGDLLLPLVLDHREIDKARGTYVRGWAPGPDGRVHPSFGFKPATGQTSSDSPNAQNYPAHGDLAQAMKAMIVTRYSGTC
jgi:uracil-DNA glycosylase family 4